VCHCDQLLCRRSISFPGRRDRKGDVDHGVGTEHGEDDLTGRYDRRS